MRFPEFRLPQTTGRAMQRSLRQVYIRGSLGTVLSIAAVAAAASQAVSFDGEIRIEQGRLVLVDARDVAKQCLVTARSGSTAELAQLKARPRS